MEKSDVNIFWFRRDLRLVDNTGLLKSLKSGRYVLPVFIFDSEILSELPKDDARISFIFKLLNGINKELNKYNSSLLVYYGKPVEVWQKIVNDYQVNSVYFNKDYEPYATLRDKKVTSFLTQKGVKVFSFKDQVIFEESEILNNKGLPYSVFTPYKNKWLLKFKEVKQHKVEELDFNSFLKREFLFPSIDKLGFKPSQIEVKPYNLDKIENYSKTRNYPSIDSTSYLGPHLRFGTVSIRQIVQANFNKDIGFISELIWREFFMQILFHYPAVIDKNFREKYNGISWRNNTYEFEKWCRGETGYPFVDAGMRQLNNTGYLHNRVRMVVAGFLCKHLLIDWRWGEAYFAQKLLDYELSSNNGNWQWAAGTGCDAAPYFRVFNPEEQQKKFDADNSFINKWLPEYSEGKYHPKIVQHSMARLRAIDTYRKALLA